MLGTVRDARRISRPMTTRDPDPYGQAALMLCETIASLLIETGKLSKEDVAGSLFAIMDVKQDLTGDLEPTAVGVTSSALLRAIAISVLATEPSKPGVPHASE